MSARAQTALPFLALALALPFLVEAARATLEHAGGARVPSLAGAAANAAGFILLAWMAARAVSKQNPPEERVSTLRRVLDGLPTAIYLCDRQNRITYCNGAAAETWGRAPGEREPAEQLASVYRLRNEQGERIKYHESCMNLGLAKNRACRGDEIILERPDGTFRTLLAYVSPFGGGGDIAPGTINVLVDVTKIKLMEKILRDANEHLENRVRDRTRELETAKDKAERSEQAKMRFLAAISHDLRTPLSGVLVAAQAMLAKGEQISGDRRRHLLQHVADCVREQITFLNDLLTLVSYEHTGQTNFRTGLLLDKILDTSRRTVALQAEAKKIKIHFHANHPEVSICGDHHQLVHLFSNLLSNAVKFTFPGGHVTLAVQARETGVEVLVRDSGEGFSPEQIQQFRTATPVAPRPGTQGEPGTGLGLAIVRHVVELHGAKIHLESQSGRGSCFTIGFPRADHKTTSPEIGTDFP